MSRKSSIHFQPVSNVRFAVSHSERTDLSEPAYLLPKEHQLDNIVITGSLSENDLSALFIQQKEGMTRQAKTAGASPFWEGVVVLPNTDGREQSANLQTWKKEYEKTTKHKVLHMSVHLDEGYLDEHNKPQYNPHAHVIVTRMDSKNRVINLDRKQLADVQDLTASALQMERGSTLEERRGKRGRAHVPHREFRSQADEKRLELEKPKAELARLQKLSKQWSDSDSDMAKVKDLQAKLDSEPARLAAALEAQKAVLNEQYRLDRERMKQENADALAAGLAKMYSQEDYQALKKVHEADLVKVKKELAKAQAEAANVPALETKITQQAAALADLKTEALGVIRPLKEELNQTKEKVEKMEKQITQLQDDNTQLTALAKEWAAKAKAYQAEKAEGTPAHLIIPKPTRTAVKPPNDQEATTPLPTSEKQAKDLIKRLQESFLKMVEWVKSIGAGQEVVGSNTLHIGPVKQLDEFHCVQKTGREYAIHKLADLDNTPALDDPKMEIKYRNGKGTVLGKLGKSGVQI